MKRLAALLLVVATAACSDPSGPESALEGNYILMGQHGQQLPAPQHEAGELPILVAGELVVEEDGTFVMRHYRRVEDAQAPVSEITWTGTVVINDGETWFNFSGFEFSAEAERSGDAILLMGGEWYEGFLARSM